MGSHSLLSLALLLSAVLAQIPSLPCCICHVVYSQLVVLQVRTQMFLQVWGSSGGPQGELELEKTPFPGSGLGLLCSWKNQKVQAGERCLLDSVF